MRVGTAKAWVSAVVLAQALLLSSCAKTGEPRPPQVLVPAPATDLAARQYGRRIVLTVSKPVRNTDGSPANSVAFLELFRAAAAESTAAGGSPPFTADSVPHLVVGAAQFADRLRDGVFVLTDDPADGGDAGAHALFYCVRFINAKNQTAGFGNVVRIASVPMPGPPEGLTATGAQDRITLRWNKPDRNRDGSVPARIAGYNVYRTEDPKAFPPAPLNPSPLGTNEFPDTSFEFDRKYYYSVSVVASQADPFAESDPSRPLSFDARDSFPPSDPSDLNGVVEGGVVILLWVPPPESDVAGYRVYRRKAEEAKDVLLAGELVKALNYRDSGAAAGPAWVYRVTAVDTRGNESRGAEVTVTPQ